MSKPDARQIAEEALKSAYYGLKIDTLTRDHMQSLARAHLALLEERRELDQAAADWGPDETHLSVLRHREVTRMQNKIAALEAEVARKDAALQWYAEKVAGCRKITLEGGAARMALDHDGGRRATAALTPDTTKEADRG